MNAFLVLLTTTLFLNIGIGIFVYLRTQKSKAGLYFFLLALSSSIWIIGVIIIHGGTMLPFSPLQGVRLTFVGASLISMALIYFAYEFPRRTYNWFVDKSRFFFLILAVFFAIVSVTTDLIVKNVSPMGRDYKVEYGLLHKFFAIYLLMAGALSLLILFNKYRKAGGIEKYQLRYIFVGFAIAIAVAFTTNLIFPVLTGSSQYSRYGPLATLIIIVFMAYAIIRHHLLEIRVIFAEMFAALVILVLFIELILSETRQEFLLNICILSLVIVFSYFLIKGVIKESRDKTEIEKLFSDIKKAHHRLKKLNKMKSDFVSIASHQIKAPLAVAKGYVAALMDESRDKLSLGDKLILERLDKNNERLIKIVEELLDVSRIERGKLEYRFENISMDDLIKDIVEEMNLAAAQKNLYLDFKVVRDHLPKVKADVDKLHQALLNLIENAIKYTKEGGITITQDWKDDKLLLRVSDTGVGLTEKEIKSLFKKYKRGRTRRIEGLGLGLYVAKSIIEAHKGRIWVESKGKGKGSTFFVELPIAFR